MPFNTVLSLAAYCCNVWNCFWKSSYDFII